MKPYTAAEIREAREKLSAGAVPVPEAGCWLWVRGATGHGYGVLYVGKPKRFLTAHRAAWMVTHGDIPPGMFVCHKCDVRLCVNPDHLFIGTPLDNTRDMIAKGRQDFPAGERHSHAKLTTADVLEIRASGLSSMEVSKQFGISEPTANQILHGKRWAHVPDDGRWVRPPPRRIPRGEQHPAAKITAAQAVAIYRDSRGPSAIASDYPISEGLVRLIKQGRAWASVTGAKSI